MKLYVCENGTLAFNKRNLKDYISDMFKLVQLSEVVTVMRTINNLTIIYNDIYITHTVIPNKKPN